MYDSPITCWLASRAFGPSELDSMLSGYMYEGACETDSQIPRLIGQGIWRTAYCSHKPECIVTTNPNRSVLITIIAWHFQFSPPECWYCPFEIRIWCLKQEPFHMLLPLLRHMVPLNDRNCRLTMPVIKGRAALDALHHAFDIGVFKTVKKNSPMIKHIHN